MRRNDLDLSAPQPRRNCGCGFRPVLNRILTVTIWRVAVPLMHPSLIAHRPGNACPIVGEPALDFQVSFGICVPMITIYDVDIAPQSELDRMVVQVVPDSIPNDASADPTIMDSERCDSLQQRHQKRLFSHEVRHIPKRAHLTNVTIAGSFGRSASGKCRLMRCNILVHRRCPPTLRHTRYRNNILCGGLAAWPAAHAAALRRGGRSVRASASRRCPARSSRSWRGLDRWPRQ